MDGIFNINKPAGMSSFKCLSIVKRRLWEQLPADGRPKFKNWRVGFLGTLDPLASGVLVLLCGKATKLADKLHRENSKTYIAEFEFGYTTDTLDSEGQITGKTDKIPDKDSVIKALKGFIGKIDQIPPKYSAKSINGVRAYTLARKGEEFELASKQVEVFRFEFLEQISAAKYRFLVECGAGTYIRSLARDLAQTLGTAAVMTSLVRTECGGFKLEDSVDINKISKENFADFVISYVED